MKGTETRERSRKTEMASAWSWAPEPGGAARGEEGRPLHSISISVPVSWKPSALDTGDARSLASLGRWQAQSCSCRGPRHVPVPALPPPPGRPPKLPFLPGTGDGREPQRGKGVSVEGTFESDGRGNSWSISPKLRKRVSLVQRHVRLARVWGVPFGIVISLVMLAQVSRRRQSLPWAEGPLLSLGDRPRGGGS